VLIAGLTGGIGSGKSTVSALLRSYGAVLVDSDVVAREVVAAGSPGLAQLVGAFGEGILLPDGVLNRPALGQVVFGDKDKLAVLNAITHPLIAERTAIEIAAAEQSGASVLVHDIPLLVEVGAASRFAWIIVVSVQPETQVDRLVRLRGMAEADARARIAAQAPLADKLAVATHVIDNDGPEQALPPQVRAVWEDLLGKAQGQPDD
jgi:dephospho-CoA kinase